jgi:hypothetical protein
MVASLLPTPIVRPALNALQNELQSLLSDDIHAESFRTFEGHVHPINYVRLSNGQQFIFKTTPCQSTALLRRERRSVERESRVLSLFKGHGNQYIPQLVECDPKGVTPNPHILMRYFIRGVPLTEMESRLSPHHWDDIDRKLGDLVYTIGRQTSKSFGCVSRVSSGVGSSSWRHAFLGLVESTIRDAEDMFISLQYNQIRQELYRLAPVLDSVIQARLVVVDIGKKSHLIINPETKQLSGIVDFSWAVWGDVLMAGVFEDPSQAFLHGYGSNHPRDKAEHTRLLLFVPQSFTFFEYTY